MSHHETDIGDRNMHGRLIRAAALTTTAVGLLTACAVNPVTGRSELSLISEAEEIRLGRQEATESLTEHSELMHPEAQAMVRRIGTRMAARSERPGLPWEFHVIDDPVVNAFAAPGGFVFVTRGLLTHLTSEAELAAVLGHEVAHVTARHSARAQSTDLAMDLLIKTASASWPSLGKYERAAAGSARMLGLKFSRDHEAQSDEVGFRYALAQGYDVRQMANVFRMFERVEGASGARVPGWQRTHPNPGNRALRAQQRADSLPPAALVNATVNRNGYLRMINGMIFGENPRLGFFVGARFYHPDLAFQVEMPETWRGINRADRVIAASADGTTQLHLTFGEGSPAEAVQRFVSEDGMSHRGIRHGSINGLPTSVATFDVRAGTPQALVGEVGAIHHGGRTYVIFGFMSAQSATRLSEVGQMIRSFRPLTDRQILAVRPAVLHVVELPMAMTGQAFVERYPSSVPPETIYTINGVEANTMLPKGTLIKRVVAGRLP
jgi:predicted Zn-dependent protease